MFDVEDDLSSMSITGRTLEAYWVTLLFDLAVC